jgi:transposase-like protein
MRKKYDEAFKRSVVRLHLVTRRPVSNIAALLGLEQSMLHKWKKRFQEEIQARPDGPSDGKDSKEELATLKKELFALKESFNVLKAVVQKTLTAKCIEKL